MPSPYYTFSVQRESVQFKPVIASLTLRMAQSSVVYFPLMASDYANPLLYYTAI